MKYWKLLWSQKARPTDIFWCFYGSHRLFKPISRKGFTMKGSFVIRDHRFRRYQLRVDRRAASPFQRGHTDNSASCDFQAAHSSSEVLPVLKENGCYVNFAMRWILSSMTWTDQRWQIFTNSNLIPKNDQNKHEKRTQEVQNLELEDCGIRNRTSIQYHPRETVSSYVLTSHIFLAAFLFCNPTWLLYQDPPNWRTNGPRFDWNNKNEKNLKKTGKIISLAFSIDGNVLTVLQRNIGNIIHTKSAVSAKMISDQSEEINNGNGDRSGNRSVSTVV